MAFQRMTFDLRHAYKVCVRPALAISPDHSRQNTNLKSEACPQASLHGWDKTFQEVVGNLFIRIHEKLTLTRSIVDEPHFCYGQFAFRTQRPLSRLMECDSFCAHGLRQKLYKGRTTSLRDWERALSVCEPGFPCLPFSSLKRSPSPVVHVECSELLQSLVALLQAQPVQTARQLLC